MKSRKSASHGEAGYARRPHDAYFTEPWVARALLAAVDLGARRTVVWEPACGDGRMARPLAEAGYRVKASDIAEWGFGTQGVDFLDRQPALSLRLVSVGLAGIRGPRSCAICPTPTERFPGALNFDPGKAADGRGQPYHRRGDQGQAAV
jgi:hypothetical protein